jgi:hypothetical protein
MWFKAVLTVMLTDNSCVCYHDHYDKPLENQTVWNSPHKTSLFLSLAEYWHSCSMHPSWNNTFKFRSTQHALYQSMTEAYFCCCLVLSRCPTNRCSSPGHINHWSCEFTLVSKLINSCQPGCSLGQCYTTLLPFFTSCHVFWTKIFFFLIKFPAHFDNNGHKVSRTNDSGKNTMVHGQVM